MTRQLERAVREAAELYRAMAEVQTISKDTAMTVEDWRIQVRRLSDTYRMAQADIVEGLYQVTSNQIAAGQGALAFVASAAPFAKATRSTMTDAINILSSAINSFNLNASQAEIISAQFFKTVELGRVRIGDMANQFGRVSVLAAQMKVDLEELNALVAHLTIAGTKYERSSTFIINLLNAMIKPSEAMKDFFHSMNVDSGQAAIQIHGLAGVLKEAMLYTRGQAGEVGELFRNLRAMSGFSAAARDIAQLERYIEAQKDAMDTYIKAQEFIMTGPGDRLLDITNRMQNVFIDIAQSFITTLILGLDDVIKKASQAMGMEKGVGISEAAAFTPALLSGFSIAWAGQIIGSMKEGPWKTFWSKSGKVSAAAFATAFAVHTFRHLHASHKYDVQDIFDVDRQERLRAMEETYHEQKKKLKDLIADEAAAQEASKRQYRRYLTELQSMWADHFKIIARGPERLGKMAGELGSFFDTMIKRQQTMLIGSAEHPGEEGLARLMIAQDIMSRIGQYGTPEDPDHMTVEMAQRFLAFGQESLNFFDAKIREIEQGGSEDEMFYMVLQQQRQTLLQGMQHVVHQMAQETGIMLSDDMYANLAVAKTQEEYLSQMSNDLSELNSFLQGKITEGTVSLERLVAMVYESLPTRQQGLFERTIGIDPLFHQMVAMMQEGLAIEDKFIESIAGLEKRIADIGMGDLGPMFTEGGLFAQLFRGSQIMSDMGIAPEIHREAIAIRDFVNDVDAMIPEGAQREFAQRLKDFMDSFEEANKQLKEVVDNQWFLASPRGAMAQSMMTAGTDPEMYRKILELIDGVSVPQFAQGGIVPGKPKGTDTVPAWLTPGEFVVNAQDAQRHAQLLETINSGYFSRGGMTMRQHTARMAELRALQEQERPRGGMWSAAGSTGRHFAAQGDQEQLRGRMWSGAGSTGGYWDRYETPGRRTRLGPRLVSDPRDFGLPSSDSAQGMADFQEMREIGAQRRKRGRIKVPGGWHEYYRQPSELSRGMQDYYDSLQRRSGEYEYRSPLESAGIWSEGFVLGDQAFKESRKPEFSKMMQELQQEGAGLRKRDARLTAGMTAARYTRNTAAVGAAAILASLTGGAGLGMFAGKGAFAGMGAAGSLPASSLIGGPKVIALLKAGLIPPTISGKIGAVAGAGISGGIAASRADEDARIQAGIKGAISGYLFERLLGLGGAGLSGMKNWRAARANPYVQMGLADGGWVKQPRSHFQSGGKVHGSTVNNYSTTANVTLQSSGSESVDARKLMDAINRESYRGTKRLARVGD